MNGNRRFSPIGIMPRKRAWFVVLVGLTCLIDTGVSAPPLTHPSGHVGFTRPIREIDVAVMGPGRVAEVHVRRGDTVEAEALLMVLDTRLLQAKRRVAEATVAQTAKLDAMKIEYQLLNDRYEKLNALYQSRAGNPEEVRRALADAKVAQLNVTAAEEEVRRGQLELDEIDVSIEAHRIRSPIRGLVLDVLKDVGEYVSSNQPEVVQVVDLDSLRATFYLPTEVAVELSAGDVVSLKFLATRQIASGTVEYVAMATDAESGRVRVDVLIQNKERAYRSGVRCVLGWEKQSASRPRFRDPFPMLSFRRMIPAKAPETGL